MVLITISKRTRGIIFSAVMIGVGIIHLGVGIGIVARYHQYHEVFQQQVGLSGYNIFLGMFNIAVGILGLVAVLKKSVLLGEITAGVSCILGILALASLIAALALSGSTASHLRSSITDYMNDYIEDDQAIQVIDALQTNYQCCGVNLWLDWSLVALSGSSNGETYGRRRRRQHLSPPVLTPLTRALRQKRQSSSSSGTTYNLPSSYSVNLPLSCCKSGGTTTGGNTLGGYCVYNSYNGSSSFYVSGCLEPVSNAAFSQTTGIAVINTCLTIFSFVYCAKFLSKFLHDIDPNGKQSNENAIDQGQQQQYPYPQYYDSNNNQNQYGMNPGQQPPQNQNQYGMNPGLQPPQYQNQYETLPGLQPPQYPNQPYSANSNNSSPYYIGYNEPTYKGYF